MSSIGAVMEAEMAAQPEVLAGLAARGAEVEADVREAAPEQPAGVVLLARGTSDNAAVFGRYLLEMALGVPAGLAAPSLWTRYERHADLAGHLFVALSQSGRTPEIERVVRLAGQGGASTLAITNDAGSPLALASDQVVALDAGLERAVPATKTFTGQLAALALVARALATRRVDGLDRLHLLPRLQEQVLGEAQDAERVVPRLTAARAIVTIGSGLLYPVALEAALKLLETTCLPVLAYSASDFLHGPLAVAAPDVPVVCFAAAGPVRADVAAAARAAAERGAPVIWVGERRLEDVDCELLGVPAGVPEPLAGLVHAIRGQQLALAASRLLGRDPDAPQGLRKVTPTV